MCGRVRCGAGILVFWGFDMADEMVGTGQAGGQGVESQPSVGAGGQSPPQQQSVQAGVKQPAGGQGVEDVFRRRLEEQLGVRLDGVPAERLYDDAALSIGVVQRIMTDPAFADVKAALEAKLGNRGAGQSGAGASQGQPQGGGESRGAISLDKPPVRPEPWMWQAVKRGENGRYVGASAHTPAAVVDLVNAWADWEAVRRERLVSDPAGVLVPELEGPLTDRVMKAATEEVAKRVRAEVQAQQDALLAQAFVASNAHWIYGADGQLSEDGKRFQARVKELEAEGKLSSVEVLRRAVLEVRGKKPTAESRISSLLGQKQSGNGGAQQAVTGRLSDREYFAKALGWDLNQDRIEFRS